jgi:spore coat polysaccharide biosynthesis protein SpsF (cytidylyltransferase family)
MKVVAAIACRNNSRRLFGKPLQLLQEHTVIDYIINNLKERDEIDAIVLAISEAKGNEIFIDLAIKQNINYVVGNDRDVLDRLIKSCEIENGDTVYRVTSESPFAYLEGLSNAISSHNKNNADYTAYGFLPDGVMFELINLEALKYSHKHGEDRHRSELVTLYINENTNLFKINILELPIKIQRPNYRLTIDFPEDLILCRKIISHFGGDNFYIPYQKIIAFLDDNPDLRKIVDNVSDNNYIKPYH